MGIGYWTLLSPRTTSSSLKLNISPACVTSQMYFLLASLLVASVFAAPQSGYRARLEDEWANLNPFIANTRASPAKQAEMQAKWNEFLPYLDYLKGAPGAPGTCSCELNNEYLPPPGQSVGLPGPPGPAGAPGPLVAQDLLATVVPLVPLV